MTDMASAIDETIGLLTAFKTMSDAEILACMRRLENLYQIIHYFVRYGNTPNPARIDAPKPKHEISAIRCSIADCQNPIPFFNIKSGVPNNGTDWRCLNHIPKELTFPIGLWGEEWIAAGRKVAKDPRD